MRDLARDGHVLAYHDRSDGGLLATLAEMAFAGHVGVSINLDVLAVDALARTRVTSRSGPSSSQYAATNSSEGTVC